MTTRSYKPTETPKPRTTTVKGAATYTGLSERYIWKLIAEKKIRAAKVGNRTLPFVESLDELLVEQAA